MKRNNNFGFQTLDNKLTTLLKPLFDGNKKEFLIINNLVKNWEEIIGKKYATLCYPKTVHFDSNSRRTSTVPPSGSQKPNNNSFSDYSEKSQAKLTIAVHNAAVGFFLQNNSEYLIEKIASLYGYKAVNKVIITQEPKDSGDKIVFEKKLSAKKEEVLKNQISDIEDKELAKTLETLGRDILK